MRIAIYYPWVYLTSGVERTILEICKRSKNEYTIFTNHFDKLNTYPEFSCFDIVKLKQVSVERKLRPVLLAAITILTQKIDLSNFDALVVNTDGLGDLIMNRNRERPVLCICHTPLRPVFDIHYRNRILREYKGSRRLAFCVFSALFKILDRFMWSRYDYVFFNSKETLSRSRRGGLLKGLAGRYEVLNPGIDSKECKPAWIYEQYFLLPGRIMWTKNIEVAIRAFILFKERNPGTEGFRLIIAGQVDTKSRIYIRKLQKISAARHDIEYIISPTDERLHNLYKNCFAVLFPSFNEDWGIVPLEANAYGKPVIASNKGGPAESQIDEVTGFLVEPKPEAFAQAMEKLGKSKDLLLSMGHNARRNALKYDWSQFINKFDKVLEGLSKKELDKGIKYKFRLSPKVTGKVKSMHKKLSIQKTLTDLVSRYLLNKNLF